MVDPFIKFAILRSVQKFFCDIACPLEWLAFEEKWTECNGGKS